MNKYKLCQLIVCCFAFSASSVQGLNSIKDIDTSPLESIYYDPKSLIFFRLSSIENMLINTTTTQLPMSKTNSDHASPEQVKEKTTIIRRVGFRSNGCTCQQFRCGCCLGVNLQQFQFNREGCMNFTYSPLDFAVIMEMYMNDNLIFSNAISAKNPPPLCIPVAIPYIPVDVEGCARLFDIYTPGQNLHMCFDFEMRIQKATALVLHFDCMRMGNDGVALVKPEDMGGLPGTTPSQIDSDVYDQVTEIKKIK